MKRVLTFIMAVMILSCEVFPLVSNAYVNTGYLAGDINGDDIVDVKDASLLLQHSMFADIYPVSYKGNLDFNHDSSIDIHDVVRLLQYSMYPDEYPIEEQEAANELEYNSNEDGTCGVAGMGNFSGTVLVIPEESPFGDTVTSIDASAFAGEAIVSVSIPGTVTEIGKKAFNGCSMLTDVYFNGSEEEWDSVSVGSYNTPLLNAEIHFIDQKQTYTVIFMDTDGRILKTETVEEGKDAVPPEVLPKDGLPFIGWDSAYVQITSDKVITAVYGEQHSITYDIDNGDSYLSLFIDANPDLNPNPDFYDTAKGLTLKNISVPGYVFLGWYDLQAGANAEIIKKIPAGSTDNYELYAHWDKITYSVDFEYPTQFNASLISMDKVTYTVDKGVVLPTPQLEGYIFAGWSDADGTIIRSIPAGSTGNKKYTANWVSKRNQAWTKTELDDPIIIEDPASGTILFTYEVGEIRNVPSYVIEDFGYINANGISKTVTKAYSTEVSESLMKSYTNTVSNATVNSYGWTLSNEWSESTSVDEEWLNETGHQDEYNEGIYKSNTGGWYVSSGNSGSSSSQTLASEDTYEMNASSVNANFNGGTHEVNTTAADVKNTTNWGFDLGVEAGANIGIVDLKGSFNANFSDTFSVENTSSSVKEENHNYNIASSDDEQSGRAQHLEKSTSLSSSWNNESGYNSSSTVSNNSSVSKAISERICEKYGYGKDYIEIGGESSSQGITSTTSSEDSYSSSVTYSTKSEEVHTETWTTDNTMSGYHRWIMADTAHVFAVVGYDIASASYFVNTYTVMENNLKPFEDYSCSTGNYNDNQNSFIRFEVPYDTIVEYVINRVGESDGLEVNASGVITGYHGTDTYVVIPEYKVVDNQDGTKKVIPVTGISETAFRGNQNIVGVNMSTYIDAIPDNAFRGCTALTEVQSCATSIGAYAFDGCTSMKAVDLGYGVEAIGQNAFTNVQTITLYAINESVVDAVIHSGAKRISLYITDRCASLDNRTLEIPASVEYFAFYGAGKTYNNLRILSDAAHTVINRVTVNASGKTPIQISSPTVELNQVTVRASGIGLILSADTCRLNLYGESYITSASGNALLCKNPVLYQVNAGYYSKLHVNKDALVCGSVTNGTYLDCSGSVVIITEEDFDKYLQGTLRVLFDANGGSVSTAEKTVYFGQNYGTLPTPTRSQYGFDGWYTAKDGGTRVTEDTAVDQNGSLTLYAHWKANAYTASWNSGTGYTITVNRTSSPIQGASVGVISSGTTVYYGDVLSITYTKADYYTLKTPGKTSITVTGNVTASDIYATAELNPVQGWVKISDVPANAQVLNQKYSYTLREYKTSGSSSLDGWTWYDTQQTSWSDWSGWVTWNPDNGVRSVEYRSVYDHTEYHYYRWTNSSHSGIFSTYNATKGWTILEDQWFDHLLPVSSYYNYLSYDGSDGMYNWNTKWFKSDYKDNITMGYVDTTFTRDINRDEWRYRDPVYTYYFYKDSYREDTVYPTDPNAFNVVEWVQYRTK